MGSPIFHAGKSVERWGGKVEDYLPIHEFMDSSKAAVADLRHRALTHNSWFVTIVLERVFGPIIEVENGGRKTQIPVREIGQYHVMEDFNGSFPSAMDYIQEMDFRPWMDNGRNGERPPSHLKLQASNEKPPETPEEEEALQEFPDFGPLDNEIDRPCSPVPGLYD